MGNSGVYQKYMKSVFKKMDAEQTTITTPVQNTWYQIFHKRNCRVDCAVVYADTTGEILQVRAVVDGVSYPASDTAGLANTRYYCYILLDQLGNYNIYFSTNAPDLFGLDSFIEGRDVLIEFRKTTANAADDIMAACEWGQQ